MGDRSSSRCPKILDGTHLRSIDVFGQSGNGTKTAWVNDTEMDGLSP
jgi:hypothetical protein